MSAGKPPLPPKAAPDPAPPGPPPRSGQHWLAAVLPRVTRASFRRRNPAAAALLADWPSVVGPALAAVTQPLRLSRGRRGADGTAGPGTLTIRCAGPVALELQHLAPQLMARINAHAGFPLVGQLRFERGSITPQAPPAPRLPPEPPADEHGLEAVADAELRAALARLRRRLRPPR